MRNFQTLRYISFEIVLVSLGHIFILINNNNAAFNHRVFSRNRVMGLNGLNLLQIWIVDVQELELGHKVVKLDSLFWPGVCSLSKTSLVGTWKSNTIWVGWLWIRVSRRSGFTTLMSHNLRLQDIRKIRFCLHLSCIHFPIHVGFLVRSFFLLKRGMWSFTRDYVLN